MYTTYSAGVDVEVLKRRTVELGLQARGGLRDRHGVLPLLS